MTNLGILARFPLGVYQGHKADGSPDAFPDPARLQAALLSAAAQGPHAIIENGQLAPSEESLKALKWLEENPPTGLQLPDMCPVYRSPNKMSRFMYREVAYSEKDGRQTERRAVSDGWAVSDTIGWQYDKVPADIAETITQLCGEVPSLGEASSFTALYTGDVEPTHTIDTKSGPFEAGGMPVRVPVPGRINALMRAHAEAYPAKVPTKAGDKTAASDTMRPSSVPTAGLGSIKYQPVEAETSTSPWEYLWLLEVDGEGLKPEQYVKACSLLHKALVAAAGFGAPSLITGRYPKGHKPANSLALQYLPARYLPDYLRREVKSQGVLLVLVPASAPTDEAVELGIALRSVETLYAQDFPRLTVKLRQKRLPAHGFWDAPKTGYKRLWRTLSAAVPESRVFNRPKKVETKAWTFADAALLSMAYAWRDSFEAPEAETARERIRSLRDQVAKKAEAKVLEAHRVTQNPAAYAYKLPRTLPAEPWRGIVDLGNLATDTTLVAIGQSRHMGGGLLVPFDVPTEEYDRRKKEEEHD